MPPPTGIVFHDNASAWTEFFHLEPTPAPAFPKRYPDWDSLLNTGENYIPLPSKEGQQHAGISTECLARANDPALRKLLLSMLDFESEGDKTFMNHLAYPDFLARRFRHEGKPCFATCMLVEGSEAGAINPVAQIRVESFGNPHTIHILSDPQVWPSSFLACQPITIVALRANERKPVAMLHWRWVSDILPSLNKEQRAALLLPLKDVDEKKPDSIIQIEGEPYVGYGFNRADKNYLALFTSTRPNLGPSGMQSTNQIQIQLQDDPQNFIVDISQPVQQNTATWLAARMARQAQ
jgi:hypothetical protein